MSNLGTVGDNNLLGRCPPEISLKVVNLKNGYYHDNKSKLLERFFKDYNSWMPDDVKERVLNPGVRSDEEDGQSSTSQDPAADTNVTLGQWGASLCIAMHELVDDAMPGLPAHDWARWSAILVSLLQLGITAIPWALHCNWSIFLATAAATLLEYMSASLPQS
jgi:hypothetical protein